MSWIAEPVSRSIFWREDALACTPDECHGYAEKTGIRYCYSVFTTKHKAG